MLGEFPLYSVVIMVINVVIDQARASRPTSRKPRVLHRPIVMEDLYMELILFIYLICCIIFYYKSVTTFIMMMMGNPQSMGKPHRSLTLLDHFEQSGNIVDFKIIGFFWRFLAFLRSQ